MRHTSSCDDNIFTVTCAICISEVLCEKQIPRRWSSDCIPRILLGLITCPCPWYMYPLLTQNSSRTPHCCLKLYWNSCLTLRKWRGAPAITARSDQRAHLQKFNNESSWKMHPARHSSYMHIKNHPWNWIHRYWNWFHGYWCTPMPIRNESINPVSAVRKLGASKRIFIRRNAKYKACSHWQTLCHHRDSLNGNEYLY